MLALLEVLKNPKDPLALYCYLQGSESTQIFSLFKSANYNVGTAGYLKRELVVGGIEPLTSQFYFKMIVRNVYKDVLNNTTNKILST